MGTFPNFSNIAKYTLDKLKLRKNNPSAVSKLNAWVRITSGVKDPKFGNGLTIVSNPNFKLFGAAGISSIYGNDKQSGTIGETWDKKAVNSGVGKGYRPSPIIESIEVDEGAGNLSRKASFSIKCFSKEQLEIVSQYFQEPGFTIFLEWGWNTADSMKGLVKDKKTGKLTANNISDYWNFDNTNARRALSKGEYDNYLGFITGGGISSSTDTWTLDVKCTGFTELPSYLVNGDNSGKKDEEKPQPVKDYATPLYSTRGMKALGKKRWMIAFNGMPSNRKTQEVKNLINVTDNSFRQIPISNIVNYINFDSIVRNDVNTKANGSWFGRTRFGGFLGFSEGAEQTNEDNVAKVIEIPHGTIITDENRFIRFGTLMKIFNEMKLQSLPIGGKQISMIIHSEACVCSAFDRIFSTDKTKLFIPNPNTPKFDLVAANDANASPITKVPVGKADCSVSDTEGTIINFPAQIPIRNGKTGIGGQSVLGGMGYTGGTTVNLDYRITNTNGGDSDLDSRMSKDAKTWGLLDDLYVNYDWCMGILNSSNYTRKDALYQILNGMSSAVNDLWDFQIGQTQLENDIEIEGVTFKKGDDVISIKEANFTHNGQKRPTAVFDLEGTNSIFKDASLSLDMGGAKMNQIIGKRLKHQINEETQPSVGKLNALDSNGEGYTDLVLNKVRLKQSEAAKDNLKKEEGTKGPTEDEIKAKKEKNFAIFLGKLGSYPKVHLEGYTTAGGEAVKDDFDFNDALYAACFGDKQLLKLGKAEIKDYDDVSILLPINFTFTIHGISGIKRGDKFIVKGIPKKYEENGFFQVLGIKHSIQGMEWSTEIEGGYRTVKK